MDQPVCCSIQRLAARAAKGEGAQTFLAAWRALQGAGLGVHLGRDLRFTLTVKAEADRLPSAARRLLDPAAFATCCASFLDGLGQDGTGVVAIDGKTMRRSFDRAAGKSALHVVTAFAVEHGAAGTAAALFTVSSCASLLAGWLYGLRQWRTAARVQLAMAAAGLAIGCLPVLVAGSPLELVGSRSVPSS